MLTTHMEMGGIPVYVSSLARGLKAAGHEPVVLSSGGWLERRLAASGVRHRKVWCDTSSELHPRLWLAAFPKLLLIVREERPDILHAQTRVTQVLAWALHLVTRVPFVTTCHGLYKYRIGRRIFRCWGKSVMAISRPSMDRLVHQYHLAPPHQVTLVRNGIETARFAEAPDPGEAAAFRRAHGITGSPVIGAIARLSPVKGLDLLIRMVPDLLKEFPNLQVLLVGDGPSRADIVRLAYQMQVAGRVVIAHSVDDTRIPLSMMEIFAAPALREGFGLAIVEAMAAGVAVVATRSGGPAEIIDHGTTGLLVEPENVNALREAIRTLLSDPVRRIGIAQAAKQKAAREFDMGRVTREVESVYKYARNGSS